MISQESIIDKKGEGKGNVSTSLIPLYAGGCGLSASDGADNGRDRTFDTVCVNPEDLK